MRTTWGLRLARNIWRRHPGVRADAELTRGERAADRLRNNQDALGLINAVHAAVVHTTTATPSNDGDEEE